MHLMIDLETLGTNPDCVVTQIGVCVFDINVLGLIHWSENYRPDPNEQIFERKRTITWDTFRWWMGQSNDARESMIKNAMGPMDDCLQMFINDVSMQFGWKDIEGVWSHGLTFDVAIMEHLFRQYEIKCPWKYNVLRDTRTIFALVPRMVMRKALVAHDAREDALNQAMNIQKAMFRISIADEAECN